MKVYFLVFLLFLLSIKNCRSKNVLSEQIPEQWKKYPIQKLITAQKNDITKSNKLINPLGSRIPALKALPLKTHVVNPVVNLHNPMVSPKLHYYMKPNNEILPKSKKELLRQPENFKDDDSLIEDENKKNDVHVNNTLESDSTKTVESQIQKTLVKVNSDRHDNNKQEHIYNDPIIFRCDSPDSEVEIPKQERKIVNPKMELTKTIPGNLINNSNILKSIHKYNVMNETDNNTESLKTIKVLTNNSNNHSGNIVDNTRSYEQDTNRKSDIEIVINHDTNNSDDSGASIIIHNEDYRELSNIQDFNYQNQQDPTTNIQEVFPYNGQTTNQYTNPLSDKGNYANEYQLEADTKQDKTYPFYDYTLYEASIVPQGTNYNIGKISHDYSHPNIWRSSKNTDVIVRNHPKNIKLYFNYASSGNKKFNQRSFINSHSGYTHQNNFKPHYLRYVHN